MFSLFFLGFCGICFGATTAAGVFTVLSAVGLVPRFIGKTHSAKDVWLYESMIIAGTTVGGLFSSFSDEVDIGSFVLQRLQLPEQIWIISVELFLAIAGVFSGMFVGCLALAIAEMLDSIPIFARRISFRHGLGFAVLSMALGKLCGSFFYFINIYSG